MERIILEAHSEKEILQGIERFYIDGVWKIREDGAVYNEIGGETSHFHVEVKDGIWRFGK